jgi:hypothetical protein
MQALLDTLDKNIDEIAAELYAHWSRFDSSEEWADRYIELNTKYQQAVVAAAKIEMEMKKCAAI